MRWELSTRIRRLPRSFRTMDGRRKPRGAWPSLQCCNLWKSFPIGKRPMPSAVVRLVQGGAESLLLDTLLALCQQRGWRKRPTTPANRLNPCAGQDPSHQPPDVRGRSDALCASTVSLLSPPSGLCPAVMPNGSSETRTALRKAACPNRKGIASLWPNRLGKMGRKC